MSTYSGYVYIWYDTRAKLFYVGGHFGLVEDRYICSSAMMLRAYKKRPDSFRFRVLEYVYGDKRKLREAEQRWLDMIDDRELYWTPNIYAGTVRYYNKKKVSAGGNGHANRGKSHAPWNKGMTAETDVRLKYIQSAEHRSKLSRAASARWQRHREERKGIAPLP